MTGKHVILFAGTTEGRVLANWLDDQPGITGTVCVATEYGAELLTEEMPLKHLKVHCGRLDEDEIEAFLKKNGTHLVINCQAEAAAIYVSLQKQGLLKEALKSKDTFLDIVYPTDNKNKFLKSTNIQLSFFD